MFGQEHAHIQETPQYEILPERIRGRTEAFLTAARKACSDIDSFEFIPDDDFTLPGLDFTHPDGSTSGILSMYNRRNPDKSRLTKTAFALMTVSEPQEAAQVITSAITAQDETSRDYAEAIIDRFDELLDDQPELKQLVLSENDMPYLRFLNDSLQLKEEQEFVITSPPTRLSITDSQGTISDIDVMEQIQRVFPLMEGFTLQDIFLDPGRTFYLAGLALHLNNLETEAQLSFIRDIRRDPSTAIELFKQLSQQLDKHIKQSTHSKAFTMVDWSSLYQESLEQTINELTEAIRHEESVGLEDLRALPIDVIQGLYQICSIHLTPDGKDFYLQDRDQSPFPRHPQATSPGVLETINRYLGEDYTIFDLAVDPSLAIALTLTAFWIDYFDIGGNNIIQRITKDIFAKIRKLQDKELITPEQSSCILAATIELHQRIFGVSDGTSDEEAID